MLIFEQFEQKKFGLFVTFRAQMCTTYKPFYSTTCTCRMTIFRPSDETERYRVPKYSSAISSFVIIDPDEEPIAASNSLAQQSVQDVINSGPTGDSNFRIMSSKIGKFCEYFSADSESGFFFSKIFLNMSKSRESNGNTIFMNCTHGG